MASYPLTLQARALYEALEERCPNDLMAELNDAYDILDRVLDAVEGEKRTHRHGEPESK